MASDEPPVGGRPTSPRALRRVLPAMSFAACAAILIIAAATVLSLDAPDFSQEDPQTRDAYVGGDVTGISARVQGYLTRLMVSDNQRVHAGEVVAEIEDADYCTHVDQAKASVDAARATLAMIEAQQSELESEIGESRSAEASSVSQTVRTDPELIRQRALVHTDAGLRASLDRAVAEQREMRADVVAAGALLHKRELDGAVLVAQRHAALAALAARHADLELAWIDFGWTRIKAPIDGTLAARRVRVGDLLTPGTVVVTETPLQTVWVDANFTERQIPLIRVGQRAVVRVDAFPGCSLEATVVGMSPVTGGRLSAVPPDNTTGNFTKVPARVPVRIMFRWGDSKLRGLLRPGMSAVVTVLTGEAGDLRDPGRR